MRGNITFAEVCTSIEIHSVQHLFCQFTQRLAVEFFIQLFDLRVFMAQTQLHSIVTFIQTFDTFFTECITFVFFILRLTAATNAATGASHNFYKVVICFTNFNLFNKLTSISSTINNCYFYLQTFNIHNSITNALHATHRSQIVKTCRNFFLSNKSISSTHCSFHYTTSIAKNYACTTCFAHKVIKFFFRQISKVNVFIFRKHCQFASGNDVIHITHAFNAQVFRSSVHFISANFKFFRSTRSKCYVNNLGRINTHFFSEISFNGRSLHTDGAFSTGNIFFHFRIVSFHKFHPRRAATSKLRQRLVTFHDTFNKLTCFFHNG